jgi:hypothetical protein
MLNVRLPRPMTCEQAQELFAGLLAEDLDVENRGRVEGHLIACDECSVAFAEAIDRALAQGTLPRPKVPPLSIPPVLQPPRPDLSGRGAVSGWLWAAVNEIAGGAAGIAQRAAAASAGAIGREAEKIHRTWTEAKQTVTDLKRRWQATRRLWSLGDTETPTYAGAHLGGTGESVHIQHLNEAWVPAGRFSGVEIESGPTATRGGEFHFVVSSDDARLAGQQLICTIQLIEGEAIRFETDAEPTPDGTRWRAVFRARHLPPADEDVQIPLEFVNLYLVPGSQKP